MPRAIHVAADVKAQLGEGPVWLPADQALMWVDIKGRRLFRLTGERLEHWATPVRVGAIAPRARGGFVAATDEGFFTFELVDGEALFTAIGNPERELASNRFNDGKVDRVGRFWAGTMDDLEVEHWGTLYRLDPDHCWSTIDGGYAVTNGPAFSPDGAWMYHTDSGRRLIYRFPLSSDGSVGSRESFAHFTAAEGYPDGMTVDADGCLWVAFWDGWAVRRLAPNGATVEAIEVPVQRPTSVAFGGPDLDRLYVTSARIGLDDAALAVQPYAGALLMLEPGCRGIAELPFAG